MSEQIGFFSDNNNDEVVVEIFQIKVILYAQKKAHKMMFKICYNKRKFNENFQSKWIYEIFWYQEEIKVRVDDEGKSIVYLVYEDSNWDFK